ncbi:MAG: glycosyltransferase family 39 protein [Candidatus Parcubacteria bacterium]|nr:glycosyltransferase family 39 protein [Candidatus Parcubacteria bacterium]
MWILKKLETSKEFWFIILTSLLFFLLRLPSLFEPLWYGDEGIYQVIGTSLNHGKQLYKEVFDNKPPLLYWLYSIFHSDQFAIRLVSLIAGLLSVIVFFFLSKKLFKDNGKKIHLLTTFVFGILFALPMLEGNIANAENFMLLPILISALLIFNNKLFTAGLLLGISFLFKIVAIFDLSAFLTFCFIVNFISLKKEIKLFEIIKGFLIPIFLVFLLFAINGAFFDFIKAAFITNISYVSYGNKIGGFPFLLFIKLILLGAFISYVFKKRTMLNKTTLFIIVWFAFSLFNTLFSQRPYTHYLLVLLPSFSLMTGLIFFDKKNQKLITIFFLITLIALFNVFKIPSLKKNINYYQNFVAYVSGKKTMISYQKFFDRNTPFDYEIARFIKPKLNKNDTIFIWGNNAQLYQLTEVTAPTKYVVAYHITNYKDGIETTKNGIEKTRPKFIVVMPNEQIPPFSLINYSKKIEIDKVIIYERIF